eukprot:757753-Prorocentrum_minimum.AAC.2
MVKDDAPGPGSSGPVSVSPNEFFTRIEGGTKWAVHIHSANHVPKMDVLSESDPYVSVCIIDEFNTLVEPAQIESTLAFEDDTDPTWNAYRVLTTSPSVDTSNCKLKLTLWDYDPGDPDDIIGEVIVPLSELADFKRVTKPVCKANSDKLKVDKRKNGERFVH